MNTNISIDELLEKKPNTIIDIRDSSLYLKGHIYQAKSIPKNELITHPDLYLDKENIYYIYCSSGVQSRGVVEILNRMGYHTVNIIGGYHNYLFRK